jgi:hypothetical protein
MIGFREENTEMGEYRQCPFRLFYELGDWKNDWGVQENSKIGLLRGQRYYPSCSMASNVTIDKRHASHSTQL